MKVIQLSCVSAGMLAVAMLLHGCGGGGAVKQSAPGDGAPPAPRDVSDIPNAVPKHEPLSRYGNPESYVVFGKRYYVMNDGSDYAERGIASWYGTKFHGRRTSSGESYNMYAMTAAHKTLPLPTYVRVTNLENRRSVIVKVNDRGPFHDNRIIDMSYAAASKLGMLAKGTALVEVRTIEPEGTEENQRYVAADNTQVSVAASADTHTPVARSEKFYIQVGAFSSLDNAERIRARLDKIENKYARISQAVVDNTTLYRVRIGPLEDVNTADRIVTQLPEYGITEHRIVIDE